MLCVYKMYGIYIHVHVCVHTCTCTQYVHGHVDIHDSCVHLLCCFRPLLLCLRELMLLMKYLLQNTASSSCRVECRLSTFTTFDSLLESYYIQGNRTMLQCTHTSQGMAIHIFQCLQLNKCVCVLASESNNTFIDATCTCTCMYMCAH